MIPSAFLFALACAIDAPQHVFVDTGELAGVLTRALANELGDAAIVEDRANADVIVSLRRDAGSLVLAMHARGGELLLGRAFELSGGEAAAMRQVVLAVVAAMIPIAREPNTETTTATATATAGATPKATNPVLEDDPGQWDSPRISALTSTPAAAEAAPPRAAEAVFSIDAAGTMTTTDGVSGVLFGARAGVDRAFGPILAGAALEVSGICCELGDDRGIAASVLRIDLFLRARWLAVLDDGLEVGPELSFGAGRERLSARATAFVGDEAVEDKAAFRFIARGGIAARFSLSSAVALVFAAGSDIRAPRLEVSLPRGFPGGVVPPLDTGIIAAYAGAGVEVRAD